MASHILIVIFLRTLISPVQDFNFSGFLSKSKPNNQPNKVKQEAKQKNFNSKSKNYSLIHDITFSPSLNPEKLYI